MRAGMMRQIGRTNAELAAVARDCRSRDGATGSVAVMARAMTCLSICAVGDPQCRIRIGIAAFRKVGCHSAAPEAGYRCEFTARLDANSAVTRLGLGLIDDGAIQSARFVRTGGQWEYFPQDR